MPSVNWQRCELDRACYPNIRTAEMQKTPFQYFIWWEESESFRWEVTQESGIVPGDAVDEIETPISVFQPGSFRWEVLTTQEESGIIVPGVGLWCPLSESGFLTTVTTGAMPGFQTGPTRLTSYWILRYSSSFMAYLTILSISFLSWKM